MKGSEIPPPICPEFRLYVLCKGMKWSHLPEPGGLYAQNPGLLDRFQQIMAAEAREEAKRQREEEARSGKGRGRVAGRRRR